jgi:hypothetical protein
MNIMKKLLFFSSAILLTLSIKAQTVDVEQNSTHNFSVSVNNGVTVPATGYSWTADAALGANFTSTNTASTSITFTGALNNTGNVTVYATSQDHSCSGNPQTKTFRIVSQLAVSANLPALTNICPITTSNPAGGDIPAFTISFVNPTNNPVNVTSFTYQIVDPANVAGSPVSVTVGGASSYNLNIATAYDNTQTGTYTIRIVSITPATGNTVSYPNASGLYPQTTITVDLAPELTW